MDSNPAETSHQPPGLPLVVQLGFAGSRLLYDATAHPQVDNKAFEQAVQQHLTARLAKLQTELGLSEKHFFCGMSQLAVGADTLFTRACQALAWPQRLLLPQPFNEFVLAEGSSGPDFTLAQREAARELFASSHIIEEYRVSHSSVRGERFHEVNLELTKLADVLVCLVRAEAPGKQGGTLELIKIAKSRSRPVLVIRVSVDPPTGLPQFAEEWIQRDRFKQPALPPELQTLQTTLASATPAETYFDAIHAYASNESKLHQARFKYCAYAIVGTHMLATAFATGASMLEDKGLLPSLLGVELALLASGLATHQFLHHSHTVRRWALSRLLSQTRASARAMRQVGGALIHFFSLPMPASLQPLLRTMNVLHLRDSRKPVGDWQVRRDNYVRERLTESAAKGGQIDYYAKERGRAHARSAWAQKPFLLGSLAAITATFVKLFFFQSSGLLGFCAIVLPVVAVGALSLAASFDLEARAHTYGEMLDFLSEQQALLEGAQSQHEFRKHVLETEARLLGETATWYARRAFTGVT